MTVTELQARLADPRLTDRQRQAAARAYGQLLAADAACDAYGTRILPIQRGVR